ncbi:MULTISPECIES: 2-amino-4-hydroxy-6-hydroxymethyldihydropteridine diphosphokinase [unclassified Leptolyngbya]|uniref:2-amino-4-hydroxy-6- hydroxymethyldihydropteridine diphosphokinase n=1 Tax=unclassified Leptolyngbya TaxID=2650499 RepID=UPI0016886526|nr:MULTISPECIES: 2-amino-4-hydroxy-6-hydroxymethyldihydropteridine diphosphokinase [unclassified Leptolyngbya]MBD1914168.1 2-amino-4-hydroxy-6-hydroxymethyldihydropteridine diphosphokinase [Leptolyngbya sp. FACHB-8]MBD2157175.1 2-amino-4-hydroxy-6-hydroxymethyldihydropteridine diphosphokinase [Leptolyngbya sp. FACHB-16]
MLELDPPSVGRSPVSLHRAAIALGSNLGDSHTILQSAIAVLDEIPGIQVNQISSFYRTAPLGPPQPDYLNACVLVSTYLSPEALLETLLEIEAQFGRVRHERWGPRLLDLDLLLYDGSVVDSPDLQIPHPRMHERAFVLVPLAEIASDWIVPVWERTVNELLQAVDPGGVRLLEPIAEH